MANMSSQFESDDPRDSHEGDRDWVSEDDIKALATERDIFGEDEETQALRILKENLPTVVHAITKLARTASSETVRLNAQKYVIDRNLGKITEPDVAEDDVLKKIYEDVTVD